MLNLCADWCNNDKVAISRNNTATFHHAYNLEEPEENQESAAQPIQHAKGEAVLCSHVMTFMNVIHNTIST